MELNNIETNIMTYFLNTKGVLRIYDIEQHTQYNWHTCDKYCKLLVEKGFLIKVKKNEYKLRVALKKHF